MRHQYADAWDFKVGRGRRHHAEADDLSQGPDGASIEYDSVDSSVLPDLAGKQSQLLTGEPLHLPVPDGRAQDPGEVRKAIAVAFDYDGMWKIVGNNDVTGRSRELDPAAPGPGLQIYVLDISGVKLNGTGSGDPVKAAAMLKGRRQ